MEKNTALDATEDIYVVTSIRIKRSVRQKAKIYAATHETTLQGVIEEALEEYLKHN